jgi:hypothetical protein
MKNIELQQSALDYLDSKFNLLLKLDARSFDSSNWGLLLEKLKQLKVDNFSSNDRILICHMDTDYYDPMLPVGTIPNNLIRCFKLLDIPMYLLLFVTNHFGISQEFDLLLADQHPKDRPTIVETLLSNILLLDSSYEINTNLNVNDIEKSGLCMLGAKRSHRVAILNFVKNNNLLDYIAVSAKFANP